MARRRGGVKRSLRRAIAIASNKVKTVTGHNVPNKYQQLYHELQSISDAVFAENKGIKKPTIISVECLSIKVRKYILVHIDNQERWTEAQFVPVELTAPLIPVVTLD